VIAAVSLASRWADVDRPDRAHDILNRAEDYAGALEDPDRADATMWILVGWVDVGDPDRARELLTLVKTLVHALPDPTATAEALGRLADVLLTVEWFAEAEAVALSIVEPAVRAPLLVRILAGTARGELAGQIRADAAIGVGDTNLLLYLAATQIQAGLLADAALTIEDLPEPHARTEVLHWLAQAHAPDAPEQASAVAAEAERQARSIIEPGACARALTGTASVWAAAGHPDKPGNGPTRPSMQSDRCPRTSTASWTSSP
jgi:hypothetical protein